MRYSIAKMVACFALIVAALMPAGCGGGLKQPGGSLKGKITYKGKGLAQRASINLTAVDEAGKPIAGSSPTGLIENSSYSIAGIPAGRYEVWFWIPEIDGYDESNMNTNIFVEANGQKNQVHDIDLPAPTPFKKPARK